MEQQDKKDFEERLARMEIILEMLNNKLDELTLGYKGVPEKLIRLEEENKNQQKEIDELKDKDKTKTGLITGMIISIVTAVIVAIVLHFMGLK